MSTPGLNRRDNPPNGSGRRVAAPTPTRCPSVDGKRKPGRVHAWGRGAQCRCGKAPPSRSDRPPQVRRERVGRGSLRWPLRLFRRQAIASNTRDLASCVIALPPVLSTLTSDWLLTTLSHSRRYFPWVSDVLARFASVSGPVNCPADAPIGHLKSIQIGSFPSGVLQVPTTSILLDLSVTRFVID